MATTQNKRIIVLNDTTLRDGAQAPGVRFSLQDKIDIAQALDRMGIDELEVGTPAMGDREAADIRALRDLGLTCRLSAWCRARQTDLKQAEQCGVDAVHISLPVSDIHLGALGKDRQWVLQRLCALVPAATAVFRQVSIGAQDATRAEPQWLATFARTVQDLGVQRLRIADTVGIGRPSVISERFAMLRTAASRLPLEFHGHNDLGMATANALAATENGAQAVSLTVNGLGERAGNTPLEQMAMALHHHPDLSCRLRSQGLLQVCRRTALAAGRPIPPDQPITGEMAFTHESGIHCHATLVDPQAYEPFAPQTIGRPSRRFAWGSHSGRAGIQHLLARAGIAASAKQVNRLRGLLT
ncbi:MAG: homocitrate synthase [Desulfatitalea sp.]|nr:hypothetical protein [Desulfatitalea sp.]NNK02396.1 homocitrate synthase [Desulfatitalea sp.]